MWYRIKYTPLTPEQREAYRRWSRRTTWLSVAIALALPTLTGVFGLPGASAAREEMRRQQAEARHAEAEAAEALRRAKAEDDALNVGDLNAALKDPNPEAFRDYMKRRLQKEKLESSRKQAEYELGRARDKARELGVDVDRKRFVSWGMVFQWTPAGAYGILWGLLVASLALALGVMLWLLAARNYHSQAERSEVIQMGPVNLLRGLALYGFAGSLAYFIRYGYLLLEHLAQ